MAKKRYKLDEIARKGIQVDLTPQGSQAAINAAEQMVKDIKSNAYRALINPERPSSYVEGWTFSKYRDGAIVFNQGDKRSLTHLLEYDFLHRGGKVVKGRPHIKPAWDKAKADFKKELLNIDVKIGGK